MPFIKNPLIKLSIDSGSINLILNPEIAEKYFSHTIYYDTKIKTTIEESKTLFRANIHAIILAESTYLIRYSST